MDIITRFWILILVVIGGVFIIYENVVENIEKKKNLYGSLSKGIT